MPEYLTLLLLNGLACEYYKAAQFILYFIPLSTWIDYYSLSNFGRVLEHT